MVHLYVYIKSFHVVFMVAWFAALFYLPRLFVYHAMALDDDDAKGNARFKVMERKLYRAIMTPSAVLTVTLGLTMLWINLAHDRAYFALTGWFHAKMTLVVLLIAYHVYCGALVRRFAEDKMEKGHVWFRFFNELPVLILIPCVIFVIVKPF